MVKIINRINQNSLRRTPTAPNKSLANYNSQSLLLLCQRMLEQSQVPKQWFCPLTHQIMRDPVIVSDGFTYEKNSIQKWFAKSNISPMTGIVLKNTNLTPNIALRNTIAQFLLKQRKDKVINCEQVKKIQIKPHKQKYQLPQLQLKVDSAIDQDDLYVRCLIQPPEIPKKERNDCSFICILDVSQSMDTDSVMGGKDVESHGFSRLDLVKHSIKTIVELMEDNDQIALVPFSTNANIAIPLTKTTQTGKRLVKQTVNNLKSGGVTNIWDGFRASIQLLKNLNQKNHTNNIFVLLLTDGLPNFNPPQGIINTLIKYLDQKKIPYPNIHVFGYGYELDTNLLTQISQIGHGTYTYIPDCSMVGTAFVNFIATALSTITNNVSVKIDNLQLGQVLGYKKVGKNTYHLGVLQYGQSREIVLKGHSIKISKDQPKKIADIQIQYGSGKQKKTLVKQIQYKDKNTNNAEMKKAILRSQYLQLLNKLMKTKKNNIQKGYKEITDFYLRVEADSKKQKNELNTALLKQLKNQQNENEGQVSKSFQKQQWWQKWGKHYIPSLYRAHLMSTCTNFKDPALQLYGGKLFLQNRNKMDTIFIQLPPPQPSAKKASNLVYVAPPVDMASYYNNYGGCIHEDCLVQMQNGTKKPIKLLKKGDEVRGGIIECMIKTTVYQHIQMIKIGQLVITPWHPVRMNGVWLFPIDIPLGQQVKIFIESYYNYVIKNKGVSLICQGIQCIGLAHHLNDNPVTAHQYFSSTILFDLQRSQGWTQGEITLKKLLRDPITNKVNGIQICD